MNAPDDAEAPAPQRVFFALWPPPAVQRELARLAAACAVKVRGRAVPEVNLHMTLAFLGEIPAPAVDAVSEAAAAIRFEPFVLSVDRLGYWRQAGIVWAGTRRCPPPLLTLVTELRAGLARLGFAPERRDFHPHVTLMRRAARRPRLQAAKLDWPVHAFCLVRSVRTDAGSAYQLLAQWQGR